MRVQFKDVSDFGMTVDSATNPKWLEPILAETKDLRLRELHCALELTKIEQGIWTKGRFQSVMDTECDRCLDACTVTVADDHIETMVTTKGGKGPEAFDDDVSVYLVALSELDLTPFFNEYIRLAVPIKKLCRRECQGLCPKCGANLNREACTCK